MSKIYISLILTLFLGSHALGDEKISSHKTDQVITIDGKATDWETIPLTFFEKDKMSVGIAHNDEYLYLLLKTRDEQIARMIKWRGLKIWLSKDGKKNRECGLIFTGGSNIKPQRRKRPGGDEDGATEKRWQEFSDRNGQREDRLIFIDEANYVYEAEISDDGFEGPQVAADTSLSFYTYEIAMPLGQTSLPIYRLDLGEEAKLLVGLEWGGRPQSSRDENSSGDYSGFSGGGGGGGGRMGGGSRMGGGGGHSGMGRGTGRRELRHAEIWIKVTLENKGK